MTSSDWMLKAISTGFFLEGALTEPVYSFKSKTCHLWSAVALVAGNI